MSDLSEKGKYKYATFGDYCYRLVEKFVVVGRRQLEPPMKSYGISKAVFFLQLLNFFGVCLLVFLASDAILVPLIAFLVDVPRTSTAIILTFLLCGFLPLLTDSELFGWNVVFEFPGLASIFIFIGLLVANVFAYSSFFFKSAAIVGRTSEDHD